MNKFLIAIYREDNYSLEVHLNRRTQSDRHGITEALKVLIGDTDLDQEKRIKYAQTLLLADADPNGKDSNGNPFLVWCCEQEENELANLLINFGCDINAANEDGLTALHAVAKTGSIELTELLLSVGADVNFSDCMGDTPLMKALYFEPSNELFNLFMIDAKLGICNSDYETVLHIAVHVNLVKEASVLIENGADVNAVDISGNTPLHCACHHKVPNTEMIKLLLKSNCNPNIKSRHLVTPIYLLGTNSKATEALRVLLEHENLVLDPVTELNQTPIFAAVSVQAFDNVKLLLQANCNVGFHGSLVGNGPQKKACSLVELALNISSPRLLKMLLLAGSDAEHENTAQIEMLLAQLSLIENASEVCDLYRLAQKPLSLQQLCRIEIRKLLGAQPVKKAQTLVLPQSLKDFITLKELENI